MKDRVDRIPLPFAKVFVHQRLLLERVRSTLGRVTSSGRFIPAVDGLRFIAIVSVLMYHLNDYLLVKCPAVASAAPSDSWLGALLARGYVGVNLFFAISGFILALPFAESRLLGSRAPRLASYYKRRVLRIEPPYIINLVIIFVLLVVVNKASARELLPHLGASLGYVHNFVYGEGSRINFVAWSLEVEVQFYLLAPLLATVFSLPRRTLRRGLLLAVLLVSVAAKWAWPELVREYFGGTVVYFLDQFLVGFLLADLYVDSWQLRPVRSRAWDIVSLVGWGSVLGVLFSSATAPLLPLAILIAYVASFRGTLTHALLSRPWIVAIGGMCYTIYLYHFYAISAVGRFTAGLSVGSSYLANLGVQVMLIVPPVFVVCSVLFIAFEKPFMQRDWPRRWYDAINSWLVRPAGVVPVSPAAAQECHYTNMKT